MAEVIEKHLSPELAEKFVSQLEGGGTAAGDFTQAELEEITSIDLANALVACSER